MATFTLSTLDQAAGATYLRYALAFAHEQSNGATTATVENLNKAVKSLVNEIPMLAGRVYLNEKSHMVIRVTLEEVDSFTASIVDLNGTSESYATIHRHGFAPRYMTGESLIPCSGTSNAADQRACAIQANFIEGGLILVICLHHAAADIKGVTTILRLMSEGMPLRALDQDTLDQEAMTVSLARSRLSEGNGAPGFLVLARDIYQQQQQQQQQTGLSRELTRNNSSSALPQPANQAAVLSFKLKILSQTTEMINDRRRLRARDNETLPPEAVTARDVLIAIVWRAFTRARWSAGGTASESNSPKSSVSFSEDIRGHLLPPLGPHWMGNAQVPVYASESIITLGMYYDLSNVERTATTVHSAAKTAASDLLVRSRINHMNANPKTQTLPTAQLIVHDWTMTPDSEEHEMDMGLGLGEPDAIRRTRRDIGNNEAIILPKNEHNQAWEVQVELQQSHMANVLRDNLLRPFLWHVAY